MTGERPAEMVADAVRRSLADFVARRPGERLAGFALCTDDDLRSLSAVGCTHEMLADQDPQRLFQPVEWPGDEAGDRFTEARRALWARAGAAAGTGFGEHVKGGFAMLVAALARLRLDGHVADDVFLVALSTDPGELLTALEDAAVRVLNPADVYARGRATAG